MEPVLPFDAWRSRPGETKVESLRRQLREAIVGGRLAAGANLPSSRALAGQLGLARNTVTAAFDLLMAEGYVSISPGARPVVVDLQRRRPLSSGPLRGVRHADDRLLAARWRVPFKDDLQRLSLPERSFVIGIPEARGFPHALWRQLMARTLRQQQLSAFGYAPPAGLATLRAAIARHVAFARALACTPEQIVVTAGAQQAFDLLARLLTTEGRTRVAVEDPGYPPLRAVFMAAGARISAVPVDDEGMCVDRIPADARIVTVTPSHQSPTGVAMSARRRLALLDFARRADAVVIEDDYDGEFRYSRRPLDALKTLDVEDRVVYVSTSTPQQHAAQTRAVRRRRAAPPNGAGSAADLAITAPRASPPHTLRQEQRGCSTHCSPGSPGGLHVGHAAPRSRAGDGQSARPWLP